jgi:hypothetical protein
MDEETLRAIKSKTLIFEVVRDKLEKSLGDTGFDPAPEPPSEEEPKITTSIARMSEEDIGELYDDFLKYYNYLTDEITRCEVFLKTTQYKLKAMEAELKLHANSHSKSLGLSNVELRTAWVESHSLYLSCLHDYLYFKQLYAAQDQRRKKMSKSMDRIWRDLTLRRESYSPTKRSQTGPFGAAGNMPPPKRDFSRPVVKPGEASRRKIVGPRVSKS